MLTADVDVRIVSEPWTGSLLAALAIVISLAALGASLWMRRSDQARVRIEQRSVMRVPGPGLELLGIEVTNVGRIGSTVVQSILLDFEHDKGSLHVFPPEYMPQTPLPARLEPGDSVSIYAVPSQVAQKCFDYGQDPRTLTVVVKTAHGTTRQRLRPIAISLLTDKNRWTE